MPSYLVTGATGQQGSAVVNHLLAAGLSVHATVRDKSSPKAVALHDRGVIIFEGTHEEPDDLFRTAAAGCVGLFLNLTIFEPGKAKAQAEAVIKACKVGAGPALKSIVLSSVYRTETLSTDIGPAAAVHPFLAAYYTSKVEVEAAVRESGIQHYTILRPPVLAYDFLLPQSLQPGAFPRLPRSGVLATSLHEEKTMPYLDEGDIARFTVAAFLEPTKFSGHEFAVAGDNLTTQHVRDILAQVSGIDIKLHRRTPAEVEETKSTEYFQNFEILENGSPEPIDTKALEEKYGIRLTRLEEYLQRNKQKLVESLPPLSSSAL